MRDASSGRSPPKTSGPWTSEASFVHTCTDTSYPPPWFLRELSDGKSAFTKTLADYNFVYISDEINGMLRGVDVMERMDLNVCNELCCNANTDHDVPVDCEKGIPDLSDESVVKITKRHCVELENVVKKNHSLLDVLESIWDDIRSLPNHLSSRPHELREEVLSCLRYVSMKLSQVLKKPCCATLQLCPRVTRFRSFLEAYECSPFDDLLVAREKCQALEFCSKVLLGTIMDTCFTGGLLHIVETYRHRLGPALRRLESIFTEDPLTTLVPGSIGGQRLSISAIQADFALLEQCPILREIRYGVFEQYRRFLCFRERIVRVTTKQFLSFFEYSKGRNLLLRLGTMVFKRLLQGQELSMAEEGLALTCLLNAMSNAL